MKLSKTTRKDPTQTKTLRESYRRDLLRLFASYRRDALAALKQSTEAGSRMLAAADIDLIRLDEMLRALGTSLVTKATPITSEHAIRNYTAGTGYGAKQLNRIGVEAVLGEGPADWRAMDALKVRNLSALRGISSEMNKQIVRELSDGIGLGESMPKLADRITGRVDGIGKTRAAMMARTETLNAFNQGAELRYAQAGIETLEWLSAHDPPRVCEECLALDGTTFRIKSSHPRPPIHPNCRCTVIPVIGKPKTVSKEDAARAKMDKIGETRQSAAEARREYSKVRKWNKQWTADIRRGIKLAPGDMIRAWTGKAASMATLKKWRMAVADAERKGAHFLTNDELALLGKWGDKKGFADKIAQEMMLSGRLTRYDLELDDLLMELRAIKGGRHLGANAAISKYEKRVWDRYSEELYFIDKNGQKIYTSSGSGGAAGFTDLAGATQNGYIIVNRVDGTKIMVPDYVRAAAQHNAAEIRTVAGDKVHIIRRTGSWDASYYDSTIRPAYLRSKRDVEKELAAAGKESRIGTEWADLQAWKRTAGACDDIEYDTATPSSLIPRKALTQREKDLLKAEQAIKDEQRLKDLLSGLVG